MNGRLDWQRDGSGWPNGGCSRFIDVGGLRWHVQCSGQGPVLLLLHGTGAATHSWRGLLPLLAKGFTVLAPDLPGHGFTAALPRAQCSLPGMASAVAALTQALDLAPQLIVGHSAGAAISAQLVLAGAAPAVRQLVWLNGALLPFTGVAGAVAPAMARWLSRSALLPRLAAWHARDGGAVQRLIDSTGSRLDAPGVAAYGRLLRCPAHVAGALAMMAGWDLAPLQARLPRLDRPVLLLHGSADRTVPLAQSHTVAARLPHARVHPLPGLGHLAHEEQPARVAALVSRAWSAASPHEPAGG